MTSAMRRQGRGFIAVTEVQSSKPEGWSGYDRRIDTERLAEVSWSPQERPLTFVCGPTPLVEAVGTELVGLGHHPARVKTERFGPTGG